MQFISKMHSKIMMWYFCLLGWEMGEGGGLILPIPYTILVMHVRGLTLAMLDLKCTCNST